MSNPEQPISSNEVGETFMNVFGTTEENEIWRIEEAEAFAQQLASQFHPNMSRAELQRALAFMKERIVGTLISEYRTGHAHGRQSNQDNAEV